MMSRKIVITGSNDFIGRYLYDRFMIRPNGNIIFGVDSEESPTVDIVADVTNEKDVADLRYELGGDVHEVIHASAMSRTFECDNDRAKCLKANMNAAWLMAKFFNGARFTLLSTHMVYDDPIGNCDELSPSLMPSNYYALTKLLSEVAVEATTRRCIILRSSVVFGYAPGTKSTNCLMRLMEASNSGEILYPSTDQFINPVYVGVLADIIGRLINSRYIGTFNVGSNEAITKYNFNGKLAKKFHLNVKCRTRANNIKSSPIDSSRIQERIGYAIPSIDAMVDMAYDDYRKFKR